MKEMQVCDQCGSKDVKVNVSVRYGAGSLEFNEAYFYCVECETGTGVMFLSEWKEKERAKFIGEPDEK